MNLNIAVRTLPAISNGGSKSTFLFIDTIPSFSKHDSNYLRCTEWHAQLKNTCSNVSGSLHAGQFLSAENEWPLSFEWLSFKRVKISSNFRLWWYDTSFLGGILFISILFISHCSFHNLFLFSITFLLMIGNVKIVLFWKMNFTLF
jgi:hypothetical protein